MEYGDNFTESNSRLLWIDYNSMFVTTVIILPTEIA